MTLSKGEKGGLLVFRAKSWHELLKISNLAQHFSVFPTNQGCKKIMIFDLKDQDLSIDLDL